MFDVFIQIKGLLDNKKINFDEKKSVLSSITGREVFLIFEMIQPVINTVVFYKFADTAITFTVNRIIVLAQFENQEP